MELLRTPEERFAGLASRVGSHAEVVAAKDSDLTGLTSQALQALQAQPAAR